MALTIKAGATDQSIYFFIQDSSSTTGAGLTGLVYNTASLVAYYVKERAAAVAITLATLAAATTAHADGGFKEVDATNMPGVYRLDLPDAAVSSGSEVVVMLKGAANMVPVAKEIQLVAFDPQDVVRMGMTSLPNAVVNAANGLFTRGTGAGQINQDANGRIDVNLAAISADATAADNAESFFDGTGYAGTGNVIPTVTTLTTLPAITAGWLTATGIAADAITAAKVASDVGTEIGTAVWGTTTRILTANTNLGILDAAATRAAVGLASANLDTQLSTIDTVVDAIKLKTDNLPSDPADASVIAGRFDTLDTAIAAVPTDAENAAAVWSEPYAGYTVDSSTFGYVVANISDATTIAYEVWNADPAGYTSSPDTFGRLALDSIAISDKLDDTMELDGSVYRFTANALEQAPSGGGGGGLDAAGVRAAIGLASANLDTQLGAIDTVVDAILVDTAEIGVAGAGLTNINLPNQTMDIVGNITGNLSGSVGSVTGLTPAHLDVAVSTRLAGSSYTAPDNSGINAIGLIVTDILTDTGTTIPGTISTLQTSVNDVPTNSELATALSPIALEATAQAVKTKTDNLPSDPADASVIAGRFDNVDTKLNTIDGRIDTEIPAIKAKTDLIPAAPAAVSDIPTTAQITTAVLTTAMTESYAAAGAPPTVAQALFAIQQTFSEFGIAGTTVTVKKLNGTTAMTFTLDDDTTPTSRTRAT